MPHARMTHFREPRCPSTKRRPPLAKRPHHHVHHGSVAPRRGVRLTCRGGLEHHSPTWHDSQAEAAPEAAAAAAGLALHERRQVVRESAPKREPIPPLVGHCFGASAVLCRGLSWLHSRSLCILRVAQLWPSIHARPARTVSTKAARTFHASQPPPTESANQGLGGWRSRPRCAGTHPAASPRTKPKSKTPAVCRPAAGVEARTWRLMPRMPWRLHPANRQLVARSLPKPGDSKSSD